MRNEQVQSCALRMEGKCLVTLRKAKATCPVIVREEDPCPRHLGLDPVMELFDLRFIFKVPVKILPCFVKRPAVLLSQRFISESIAYSVWEVFCLQEVGCNDVWSTVPFMGWTPIPEEWSFEEVLVYDTMNIITLLLNLQ